MTDSASKNGLTAAIVFCMVFLLAAAGAVYFYLDASQAALAIEEIDSTEYEGITAEKSEQHETKGEPLAAQITESLERTEYQTPLGFSIVSYSEKWTDDKLVEIYDELIKNGHGDEIGYLSQVTLYPGKPDYGEGMDAAGERLDAEIDPYVYVDVPMLIPSGLIYNTNITASDISVFYMDEYDNASDIAETLAHEYGHHYTMYYFMQDDDAARASEYYALRNIESLDHEVFYEDFKEYYDNHMWDIYEIAAEDYVQFLGSPNTKRTMEYMDSKDLLDKGLEPSDDLSFDYVNVFPQENIFIPLADEIPGLRDYYYSFINMENGFDPQLEAVDFNLKVEKKSSYGYRYYNITWTNPSTDPGVLYTLVCYDSSGELFGPVRTIYGDEEPIARVGDVVKRKGNWIRGWNDHIPDEDRIFKVYMVLPDGRMLASEPFNKNF